MRLSSCGIDCDACKFTVETNCLGCHEIKGKTFWAGDTACELYNCADIKNLQNCGKCSDFPCATLEEWASGTDDTTGLPENRQRIKNLQNEIAN
jgi:hypothetical protein